MWSVKLGRVAGTTIRIHATFIALLAWIWLESYLATNIEHAWYTLLYVVLVFGCVLLHEFGHILTAKRFGIATADVTLWPIGGIASLAEMPRIPRQELLIALAGPAANVVIAVVLWLVAGSPLTLASLAAATDNHGDLIERLAVTNLMLAAFNLVPAFPMDGGRVLRAALAIMLDGPRATRIAVQLGRIIAVAFGAIGLFSSPILFLIAIFIYFAGAAEEQDSDLRLIAAKLPVDRAMITQFGMLSSSARNSDAVEVFLHTGQTVVPVLDARQKLLGVLELTSLLRALHTSNDGLVADIVTPTSTMKSGAPLFDALKELRTNSRPAICVLDDDGNLKGMVTLETLVDVLAIHSASASAFDDSSAHAIGKPVPASVS